jgi:hypothetical protein
MKTNFKTYTWQQARAKQIEYETKTGVKWDVYSTGSGTHILPIATRDTPEMPLEQCYALLNHIKPNDFMGVGLYELHERSGLPLAQVVSMAKTLAYKEKAEAIINRLGHFAGLKKKQ